jgi:segregation and condensation protein A
MKSGLEALHFRLAEFEGPLPLLLHLIEKNELEVTRVSVAAVADQFLALVASLGVADLSTTGEFVAAAARILLIQSRALLFRREPGIEDANEQDDADALARQIAEYARFKRAAGAVGTYLESALLTRPRTEAAQHDVVTRPALAHIQLESLQRAGRRLLRDSRADELESDPWPDVVYADLRSTLLEEVRRLQHTTFSALSSAAWHPLVVVTMFLALLDAVRAQQLSMAQSVAFGPISVALPATSYVDA